MASGSFSPPHKMHTEMFLKARAALEKKGATVVAGYIVPSSDGYVSHKLGADWIPLVDRIEMCRYQ